MISIDTGFTPDEMYQMLYTPFEIGCPVQLRTLTDEQVEQIPFMHQVLHLMNMLSAGELKTDWFKQKSEPKTEEIQVLRVVLKECGLVKTRIGKMSLTSKGKKLLSSRNDLLRTVMLFLMQDYNTGWLDLHEDLEVGNVGRLYSLWLLHHYGDVWRHTDFYTAEYAKAFPMMDDYSAYGYRVFNRLFHLIGLCEVNERPEDRGPGFGRKVLKTSVLDMMFEFSEPEDNLTR